MVSILKYIDETDKSLGIAGMAISLVACDGDEYLSAVSMEPGEEPLAMAEEFFFSGNPRFSAKIAWNELLKQYQITLAMLLGNVICRAFAAGHSPSSQVMDAVRKIACEHGAEFCELDTDEIEGLFNKNYAYYNRLFSHPTVNVVARDFAGTLRDRRRMTAGEVLEALHRLNSL